jgi:DNA-binding transcriptional regulator YiaG
VSDFEVDSDELTREFVIIVPLPSERLRPDSTRPKQHRYRAQDVALAARLKSFRAEHDLSQGEVAVAVGAATKSLVAEWENSVAVPSGQRKRRLIELLEGKRWKVVREAVVVGEGMPVPLAAGGALVPSRLARGQKSPNRQRGNPCDIGRNTRAYIGQRIAHHYRGRVGGWPAIPAKPMPDGATARLAEDAAYGLRWTEIGSGLTLDPRGSLVGALRVKLN